MNQGWSRVDRFSQETGAVGQQIPRSGRIEPKLTTVESSAGCTGFSDSTPLFSLSEWSLKTTQRRWTYLLFSHQRSYNYVHLWDCNMKIAGQQNPFLPKPIEKTPEEKLRQVSDYYEKQFMREMLKSMRSTISESGLVKTNQAEKIFRDQLDDEYVDQWNQKGGFRFIGLNL